MPRMFTQTHRNKYKLTEADADYHGDACEAVYLEGMELLKELHYLKGLLHDRHIAEKPMPIPPESKRWSKWMACTKMSQLDVRATERLRKRYRRVMEELKTARVSYTLLHTARHAPAVEVK